MGSSLVISHGKLLHSKQSLTPSVCAQLQILQNLFSRGTQPFGPEGVLLHSGAFFACYSADADFQGYNLPLRCPRSLNVYCIHRSLAGEKKVISKPASTIVGE